MQEEVENRTLTLVVSGTKFTGRLLKAAITKYLAHRKEKKLQKQKSRDAPVIPHGKQTVKQLLRHGGEASAIDLPGRAKDFDRVARRWGVDYAIKRMEKGKYLLFFKAKQADAITGCFSEYSRRMMNRGRDRRGLPRGSDSSRVGQGHGAAI